MSKRTRAVEPMKPAVLMALGFTDHRISARDIHWIYTGPCEDLCGLDFLGTPTLEEFWDRITATLMARGAKEQKKRTREALGLGDER